MLIFYFAKGYQLKRKESNLDLREGKLVRLAGLELATQGLGIQRSGIEASLEMLLSRGKRHFSFNLP
jgi:hypothetical protein